MSMLKNPAQKYRAFARVDLKDRTWPDQVITRPPIWCSVDLRDGNQALIEPMDRTRKLRMFETLCEIGFKEIEVGFPSASQTDFDFIRCLIEEDRVPEDVTIQVLTQAREHLIERTFESLRGARRAIVHYYNAVAPVMRRVVFNLSKDQVIDQLAVEHARIVQQLAAGQPDTDWVFQYSPEMFSGAELEFSRDIVDAVTEVWQPTPDNPCIINLPATIEHSTPNIFGDMVEWMHRNIARRDSVVLSAHPHNDRGTGTAAAEFAMMAGADRVEGCLFGNGERTGNVDVVNLALNMYSQGVHPGLDFSDIDEVRRAVEFCNQLPVHPRHPYVGDLVFTSFSGSHQDAIKKAFHARKEDEIWDMPYLPIDPKDLGRSYEAVIRVNSQSGKGGIAYLLEAEYGMVLPRRLQIEFSQVVQSVTDASGKEVTAADIWKIFSDEYLEPVEPYAYLAHYLVEDSTRNEVELTTELMANGSKRKLSGRGNGPIDAFVHGLSQLSGQDISVVDYHEHSISMGADAEAATYIELKVADGQTLFGIGIDSNIVTASLKAILSGLNRYALQQERGESDMPWPDLFRRKTDPLPDRVQRPWLLRTQNLNLSPLGEGDVGALHMLWSNPEVRRYLWDGHELAFEQTRDLIARSQLLMIERGQGLWGAFADEELVGFCGYWCFQGEQELELLFGVCESHWLKGYAGEMLGAMIEYGFEHLKLEQIRASVDLENAGSMKLLEGFGFLIDHSSITTTSRKRFLYLPRERHVLGDCGWEAA